MSGKISTNQDKNPPKKRMKSLTARQRIFVAELQAEPTLSPTEAARRAGYKNPGISCQKLLMKPEIQQAVSVAATQRVQQCQMRAEDVDAQLVAAIQFDPADIFQDGSAGVLTLKELRKMVDSSRKCISGLKIKQRLTSDGLETEVDVKWIDKLRAAKLLYQRMGLIDTETKRSGAEVNINFLSELRDSLAGRPPRPVVDSDVIDGYLTVDEQKEENSQKQQDGE